MIDNSAIYEKITEQIIAKLEAGTIPWQKPWNGGESPKNLISKKPYRGINTFILSCSDYQSPYWITYKQAQEKGCQVRKGEKGTTVIFWKFLDNSQKNPVGTEKNTVGTEKSSRKIPLLKYYTVFNVEQCDGLKVVEQKEKPIDFHPIRECEKIVHGYQGPTIQHAEPRAFYRPAEDMVNMPKPATFRSEQEYYSTLFHELAHSTGHISRLGRDVGVSHFGSRDYSKEELVAEMSAAMLCGITGIENSTIDNSASYVQSWLKVLRSDKKILVQAAGQAQKACDLITGNKPEE